jgi:uncharacterized protein YcbK (DUF882 family)
VIVLKELNPHNYPTTPEIDKELLVLLEKLNKIRAIYGKPMIVNSGLRSQEQQGELITSGKSSAVKSKHLTGQAADIRDVDGSLKSWVLMMMPLMEEVGLWIEDFKATPTWVHFQSVPPKSGKRIFIP